MSNTLGWTGWTTDLSAVEIGLGAGTGGSLTDLPLPMFTAASVTDSNMRNSKTSSPAEQIMLTDVAATAPIMITDEIRADLDQVFMERVHPVLPFTHFRRYHAWADQKNPGAARACLRSAMRAMAAAMSASSSRFCDQLYAETYTLLQAFPVRRKDDIAIEYIQAWLLMGHFELLRVGEHQAMITASRCCRLALMARLLHIDEHDAGTSYSGENITSTFSDAEERRRTFWVSFCLDRLLCSRNDYPLSLQENMASSLITTQLTDLLF